MANSKLMTNVSSAFHKVGFQLKKHSPEILVAVGIAGTVVSAVMACKATLKVNTVLDKTRANVEKIHTAVESGKTEAGESYSVEDSKKDLTIVYAHTGIELVKLYAPAVLLGAASIASILASNNILRKRNLALAAAYATVDKGFKEYRGRVIKRFGKELDRELKYNIKAKEVEETVVDENGKEKKVKKTIQVMDGPVDHSPYSIVFDCGNTGWDDDPELTKFFLLRQQDYANKLLKEKKHLFLNEVYDMLGAQRTQAGQIVGWVYDEEHPVGDNYVDFGIFNIHSPRARDFVNGYEKVIVLDFNVDGDIWSLMH